MVARVFVLKKAAKCADCGKELPEGTQVRGYPLPRGGWKIYCLKHPKDINGQAEGNPPPTDPPPAGSPKPADDALAEVGWKEVLEALLRIEGKLDVLIALLEGKGMGDGKEKERERGLGEGKGKVSPTPAGR